MTRQRERGDGAIALLERAPAGAPTPERTPDRVDAPAEHRPGWRRLGEILEELGVVGAADALLGRYEQDFGDSRRLGEILVAHGFATDDQVLRALAIQLRERERASGVATARLAQARATSPSARRLRNLGSLAMFAVACAGVAAVWVIGDGRWSWYGLAALGWLAVKLLGAIAYRPATAAAPPGTKVAVVVAFYNEDPRAFARCLESIVDQTRRPDEIWVLDDGSSDVFCVRLASLILEGLPGVTIMRSAENRGKRHAQSAAFLATRCDVVVTVDSDTVLDPSAIEEGLRPFADAKVQGVTGNVRALNHRANLLTRLIDLRYANAFAYERAAYSTLGSVVCCCGSLSFFRTEIVRERLRDFVQQRFLGVPVQYGDDRRLTQYALARGRVVLQDTAVAYTLVPEHLGHFRRQQLRWNKSFFRESLWAIARFGPRRWPFWISLIELGVWSAFSVSLVAALYVRPLAAGSVPWTYLAFAVVLAYARNVRYFGRADMTGREQVVTFALAPLYAALHAVLLTPLRFWALLTLRNGRWGTRGAVEVRA